MGFKEIKHTADWALLVWGETLETLFKEAAHGMYALMTVIPSQSSRKKYVFFTDVIDPESRLVSFLNELLFYAEQENIFFDSFDLILNESTFVAKMEGVEITSVQKLIKAVTFHNLEIKQSRQGYQVEIVFDV